MSEKRALSGGTLRAGVSTLAVALLGIAHPTVAAAQTTPDSDQSTDTTDQNTPPTRQQQTNGQPATDQSKQSSSVAASTQGEIVVTGLRQSLASAESIKRNAPQLVDSITAQDIGRLPDTNVAEALQRISGVQITRDLGEGSGIAIRGLTQVRTELNGRDIFSANGGRGLSFEEVGPDLLAGVDVYKNPSAEMIEGSLGGTVDLRTRMPFDTPGSLIAVSGAFTHYDLAKKNGGDVSGLVSDRWHTGLGEIGLLANVSWARTAFREDDVTVEPYHPHGPNPDNDPSIQTTPVPGFESQDILVPHGGGFNPTFGHRTRFSAALAAQWKPADNLEIYAQYLDAEYRFHDNGVSFFAYGDSITPTPGSTYTVDENGVATSGELHDPNVDSVVFATNRKTSTADYSGGVKWDLTSNLHLSVDYQHIHSTAEMQTMNLTISALNPSFDLADTGQDWNLIFDTSTPIPTFKSDVPGYFTDPSNYGLTAILPYAEDNKANADALRADLSWDFDDGLLKQIRVGGRYSAKSAINRNTTYGTWTAIGSTCQSWSSDAGCYLLSEAPDIVEVNPLQSTLLRGRAANSVFGPVLEWQIADAENPQKAFDTIKSLTGQDIGFRSFDDPNAFNGTIDEKDYAGYGRIALGSTIFGLDWDGNLGLRWVHTDERGLGFKVLNYRMPGSVSTVGSDGTVTPPPTITEKSPYEGNRSYTKFLPSVNLRLHVTSQLQARFAFSQNFYRPSFTQLNPSFSLSPTYSPKKPSDDPAAGSIPDLADAKQPYDPVSNPYVGTGTVAGNPNLKPERVTSFDTALEWYFSRTGYVYGTLFYKKLRDIIDTRAATFTQNIDGLGAVRFNVSTVVNISKGYAKGFEIGGQRFFDFLPGALSGLGIQANYTYVDSSAGAEAAGAIDSPVTIAVPLIGLSKHSFNLIGLYDKYGINLRVAYSWRGNYLVTTSSTGTQTLPIFSRPYGTLDASASYDINKHLSVTIDAQNITNTKYRTYQITEEFPRDYRMDDRRITGRVRLKF